MLLFESREIGSLFARSEPSGRRACTSGHWARTFIENEVRDMSGGRWSFVSGQQCFPYKILDNAKKCADQNPGYLLLVDFNRYNCNISEVEKRFGSFSVFFVIVLDGT